MADDLEILTTAGNDAEAAIVAGRLEDAGIRCLQQPSGSGAQWNPTGSVAIYVAPADLERARQALADAEA